MHFTAYVARKLATYNADPKPFVPSATADETLAASSAFVCNSLTHDTTVDNGFADLHYDAVKWK